MPRNNIKGFTRFLTVLLLYTSSSWAAGWNTNEANVVLDGYDVVAYQNADRAVKGSPEYKTGYDGVTFHFSSAENLAAFKQKPQRYLPKYNGFCAFAVGAKNAKVPANPDTFKMYNGELLMFFNDLWEGQKFNTKVPWNADEKALHAKAEKNWQTLSKSK